MIRGTVDIGIDLGTSNSCAAVMVEGECQIVPPIESGDNLTPSCVAVNRRGELEVGSAAANVLITDSENAAEGFKRYIGTNHIWTFPANKNSYTPEQLSALVLRSMRRDVQTFLNESVDSAVITIPAVFGEHERSATLAAAKEAGFTNAELVQEPIAAGLAYGWGKNNDQRPFLVYDIGGGTFDAAIVQITQGQLVVRSHRGEHALGGRDIDRAILSQIVVPQLEGRVSPTELEPSNRKLLHILEDAKKRLSRVREIKVPLEGNVLDRSGQPAEDVLTISRDDLDRVVDPLVGRTIEVAQELLTETNLSPSDINGIVLVGGPTRMPRLRELLQQEFGDMLHTRLDPMTIVARGAAMHAASILKRSSVTTEISDVRQLRIEYTPVSDQSVVQVGIVVGGQPLADGHSVQISRSDGLWHTGLIPVQRNRVITEISLGDDLRSEFRVGLLDPGGNSLLVEPSEFAVVSGLAAAAPPLSKNIGVSVATPTGPSFHMIAKRGDPLPLTKRETFLTTRGVQAGASDIALEIVFLEGESDKPQRCETLGEIELTGAVLADSLPTNSEVEVTLKITTNDVARAVVHIPLLDRTIDEVFEIKPSDVPHLENLKQRLAIEHEVVARLTSGGSNLSVNIESLDSQVQSDVASAETGDTEAAVRVGHALTRLGQMLEDAERDAEPRLAVEAMDEAENWTEEVVANYGDRDQKLLFKTLQNDCNAARGSNDPRQARQVEEELQQLGMAIYWMQPGAWIAKFQTLATESAFVDQSAADDLVREGRTALEIGDSELLKRIVIELWNLTENPQMESPEARLMWLRRG